MNDALPQLTADMADAIAAVVVAVEGVAGLDGGAAGEVATYLPGRRVVGVRADEDGRTGVHIIASYGSDVRGVADAVRAAVRAVVGGQVDVFVEDIAVPEAESGRLVRE